MATLEELKRENEKLKNEIAAKKELLEIQKQRESLMRDNRRIVFQQKHGKLISAGKITGSIAEKLGKKTMMGLQKWAKVYNENQKKQQTLQRKAKNISTKIKSSKRKSKSKRY